MGGTTTTMIRLHLTSRPLSLRRFIRHFVICTVNRCSAGYRRQNGAIRLILVAISQTGHSYYQALSPGLYNSRVIQEDELKTMCGGRLEFADRAATDLYGNISK
jgi:hypothetical protein